MRRSRELKLKDTLFHMSELWLLCNDSEREVVKKEFEKFMHDIVEEWAERRGQKNEYN